MFLGGQVVQKGKGMCIKALCQITFNILYNKCMSAVLPVIAVYILTLAG